MDYSSLFIVLLANLPELAAYLVTYVVLFTGVLMLVINKDVEQTPVDDPRRSWRLNALIVLICAVYLWSGDASPLYQPQGGVGPAISWGMTVAWLCFAAFHLRLLHPRPVRNDEVDLMPNHLGIATTALVALLEELVFRGWLQNVALSYAGASGEKAYAIFAVNLLFAFMHHNRGFTFALSAGFVGTIFSIATLVSGSLLPAIVMHVGWNVLVGFARLRPHQIVEPAR